MTIHLSVLADIGTTTTTTTLDTRAYNGLVYEHSTLKEL